MSNFDACLALILKSEGGYVNNKADPGGMTNLGVTKRTYETYVGHPVDEETMRGLTPDDVSPLYKKMYWDAVRGDDLPDGLDYCVFDLAVNSGPARAIKFLQGAIGTPQTGQITDRDVQLANAGDTFALITKICNERLVFLQSLNTWATFGKGWASRVGFVQRTATKMIA